MAIVVTVVAGCGGSQPIDVAAHPKLDPQDMVQFDFRGTRVQLDSVRLTGDSISGIPWHESTLCCTRVAYSLREISPPEVHTFPDLGTILGVVVGVVVWFGYELAIHIRD
ncbi:MAG: hypothetical protein ACRELE_06535 [Gemmatimonadales bacterium]